MKIIQVTIGNGQTLPSNMKETMSKEFKIRSSKARNWFYHRCRKVLNTKSYLEQCRFFEIVQSSKDFYETM